MKTRIIGTGGIAVLAALGFTALGSSPAEAAAPAPAAKTIFTCRTASGKVVRISRTGSIYRYSYGRPGAAPDLAFAVPKSSTSIHDGSEDIGSGSWWMTHEVTLRFNGTSYTGWWSFHRASGEEGGGIRVAKGERVLAETACVLPVEIDLSAY